MTTETSPTTPEAAGHDLEGPSTPAAAYAERRERYGRERDAYTAEWDRTANVRLVVGVAGLGLLGWGLFAGMAVLDAFGVALLVAFGVLVRRHNRVGRLRRRAVELWQLNDEALKRLARRWEELPLRHRTRAEPSHPYAQDLDIFGRASLMHLLEASSTPTGERMLSGWLRASAPSEVVVGRQQAAAELAPLLDLREELALRVRLMGDPKPDPEPFLAWAESERTLAKLGPLVWAARICPVLLWVVIGLQVTGVVPYPLWAVMLAANLMLWRGIGGQAYQIITTVRTHAGTFRYYAEFFQLLTSASFESAELRRIQTELTVDGHPAPRLMARLHRITSFVMPRSAQLYAVIQLLTLWDIHVLAALEGWQAAAGRRARAWLEALGEAEALCALATLAHDNPSWVFPEIDPAATALAARDLGHPLLPDGVRVDNDVEVGPPGTFLLVTGSNMSGKSTLLRAIGVNIVLAGAGGPVCASALRLPPVNMWTSMRVQDSLEQGVSYFMAELRRLKAVVDAGRGGPPPPPDLSRQGRDAGGSLVGTAPHPQTRQNQVPPRIGGEGGASPRLFYLLDEILQGTNTAERQIAARRIVMHLVHEGAIGAVSTHDLALADVEDVAAAARPVHFTETFTEGPDGPAMTFDYKLRPGIATSTNALRLMRMVGLDLE